MNAAANHKTYYPALDGLRGVAIVLVVLFHNFRTFDYFFFGWLGVDLFFVLSGFLITDILLKTVDSPYYLRNFYIRRMLRIFPLYYLVLVIFIVILPLMNVYRDELEFYQDHQAWFWLYLQNWLLSTNGSATGGYLNHLWSLAIEEQFYIVWPFVILWLRKPKTLIFIMLGFLLLLTVGRSVLWFNKIESLNYTNFYTFTRVDGIVIGCIIALLKHADYYFIRRNMTVIVMAMAAINFLFYFINQPYGFLPYLALLGYTTFAVLFGFLIYEIVTGNNKVINYVFTIRPLRFLGKISYGFYVFHWPLYLLLYTPLKDWLMANYPLGNFSTSFLSATLVTVFSFGISIISYYLYETPWLRLKDKFTRHAPADGA